MRRRNSISNVLGEMYELQRDQKEFFHCARFLLAMLQINIVRIVPVLYRLEIVRKGAIINSLVSFVFRDNKVIYEDTASVFDKKVNAKIVVNVYHQRVCVGATYNKSSGL